MDERRGSPATAAAPELKRKKKQHEELLPPGFRFHPTDEELVVHYLKKKASSLPLPLAIIADVDIYKFDPWELPERANFGEQEWYFFSPRDRKYPNGARPNRAATSGYWKATGTDKPILSSSGGASGQKIGVKKALVFYGGKPPKGIKTNWIMHEYRLVDGHGCRTPPISVAAAADKKGSSLRLDDWVLCRIYKKSGHRTSDRELMPPVHPGGGAFIHGSASSTSTHHQINRAAVVEVSASAATCHPYHYWNTDIAGTPMSMAPPGGRMFLSSDVGSGGGYYGTGIDAGEGANQYSFVDLLFQAPQQQAPGSAYGGGLSGMNWSS